MSMNNFLMFLQELLTMVDPSNPCSVELGNTALVSVAGLISTSGKADLDTYYCMNHAVSMYKQLLSHKADFEGRPGELQENAMKRRRLQHMLQPGC